MAKYTAQPRHTLESTEENAAPSGAVEIRTLDQFLLEMHSEQAAESTTGLPARDWLRTQFKTKSAAIRFLDSKGFKPKEIAKHLDIRQQHVRNVLSQELKRGPNEPFDIEAKWGCSHEKIAKAFVDVILRRSVRDPNSSRVLLRVCTECARGFIPGVDLDTVTKHLPGLTK